MGISIPELKQTDIQDVLADLEMLNLEAEMQPQTEDK